MCRVWRGAWWAGQRAAAHQWWASYKVRVAQSLIVVITTTTTWWEGACLSPARLPAALVAASGRQRDGTYFDPSTSDGRFAAGHTNTHTTRHAPPLIGRGVVRLSGGGVRLLFVLGILYHIIMWPVIGTSEALLEREPNAHTHTHIHTHGASRVVVVVVRVCRQQEPRLCIERE